MNHRKPIRGDWLEPEIKYFSSMTLAEMSHEERNALSIIDSPREMIWAFLNLLIIFLPWALLIYCSQAMIKRNNVREVLPR